MAILYKIRLFPNATLLAKATTEYSQISVTLDIENECMYEDISGKVWCLPHS